MVVLADADLEIASSAAVWGGYMNCGQTCISVERIYVERIHRTSVHREVRRKNEASCASDRRRTTTLKSAR